MEKFGFVAEPHNGNWQASPATKNNSEVTCYDLGGFLGSWKMIEGGVFFESQENKALDYEAMQMALNHCKIMNAEE